MSKTLHLLLQCPVPYISLSIGVKKHFSGHLPNTYALCIPLCLPAKPASHSLTSMNLGKEHRVRVGDSHSPSSAYWNQIAGTEVGNHKDGSVLKMRPLWSSQLEHQPFLGFNQKQGTVALPCSRVLVHDEDS